MMENLFKNIVDSETVRGFLVFIIFPLVVTCIAAVLSTCLHFMNEEKEVKEQGKRLTFIKYFFLKWVPALLPAVLSMAMLFFDNSVIRTNEFIKRIIFSLCFACLFVAPIATYLIGYMKLPSDEAIKPTKTAQKAGLSFFLTRWASYGTLMLIYHMIAGIVIEVFLEKEFWAVWAKNSSGRNGISAEQKALFRRFSLSLFIMALIASVSAWISYTLEKKKNPSEHKTFSNHFLQKAVSALLSTVCICIMRFLLIKWINTRKWAWVRKLHWLNFGIGNKTLFTFIYSPLLCCVIIAPILVLIEREMFTKKSVQRDSNKKSREEAQTKADII